MTSGNRRSHRREGPQSAKLSAMTVRKPSELLAIREQYGSAILAAINGALNAEEYLKLEQWAEH